MDRSLIGKECRWCGADMLSEQEFEEFYVPILRVVNFINKWFSWIPFLSSEHKDATAEVVMKWKDK
jgi:hypothetical protein